jgi:hypothetical protein
MANPPYDTPSQVQPIDGEVVVIGPGATGLSVTPEAARQTAARLTRAAEQADDGHVEQIDPDDAEALARWAERLGASVRAVRNAVLAVGGDREAVALRLGSARGAAD